MFTGIVEELGEVVALNKSGASGRITIRAPYVLQDAQIGDSIAVNGVCLTAQSINGDTFSADCMHETFERSSLGALTIGSKVNLERAMQMNGRFGGHIVSVHIDGTGRITRIETDNNAVWYTIQAPAEIMHYIIEKGSVAIDGISLTVARVAASTFAVSIIPHTRTQTTLGSKRVGDVVNLENDVIGKYVEKLFAPAAQSENESGISMDFLIENGF